jgi:hypothetical protein
MFAWLKRRHLNVQKKLLFQNRSAAEALEQFYETHGNPTEAAAMKRLGDINRTLLETFDGSTSLSSEHLRVLLAVNKELQRHDDHLFKSAMHFDEAYRPALGWDEFYRTFPGR